MMNAECRMTEGGVERSARESLPRRGKLRVTPRGVTRGLPFAVGLAMRNEDRALRLLYAPFLILHSSFCILHSIHINHRHSAAATRTALTISIQRTVRFSWSLEPDSMSLTLLTKPAVSWP